MHRSAVVAALALLCAAQVPEPPIVVPDKLPPYWVLSSLARVRPDDAPGSQTSAHLYAARGEFESFQIAVRAPASGLTLHEVRASDLVNVTGEVLSNGFITLYREHFVHVDAASPDWRGTNRSRGAGWYPDALIPAVDPKTGVRLAGSRYSAAPHFVQQGETVAVWVDMWVDRNAAPGDYTGLVTLDTDQGLISVPWTLTVWNFELPLQPSLKSSFTYWNTVDMDSLQELLRHKLMPTRIKGPDPLAIQRSLMMSSGLTMTDTGFWSGADRSTCAMKPAPSVSSLREATLAHAPGLSLYNYTADEIQKCTNVFSSLRDWGRNLHAAGIKNMVVIAPIQELFDDGAGAGHSAVDIWVILPSQYDTYRDRIQQVLSKGDEVWSYNALSQDSYSPKWLIDYDPVDFRLQAGFLSQTMGLTGLLYWRIDLWSGDTWTNVNNAGVFSSGNYPGEGLLVYPGAPAGLSGVVPSMRLKQLREGVEDYEYVALLKKLGRADWALEQIHTIAPDWKNWTRNPDAVDQVRRQLGRELDHLSTPSQTNETESERAARALRYKSRAPGNRY
jgi:hypothetical protein